MDGNHTTALNCMNFAACFTSIKVDNLVTCLDQKIGMFYINISLDLMEKYKQTLFMAMPVKLCDDKVDISSTNKFPKCNLGGRRFIRILIRKGGVIWKLKPE